MITNKQIISCPKCGELISIDDVLTHQIEENVKVKLGAENRLKETELIEQKKQVEELKIKLDEALKNTTTEIENKVAEKLSTEKLSLWKQARMEAGKESEAEKKMLEEQIADKDSKLREASKKELALRKDKNKLEEDKQNFELEKQRLLDEERKIIHEDASKKATEEQQHIIAQLNKKLADVTKAKDELARKLEQGSQQTQGEVLELELEDILRTEFPYDEILPVSKGVKGADVIQKVIDRSGRLCGQIAWEFKNTKAWSDSWIQKIKDDQRAIKADLAVIVSAVLPEGVKGFELREGVWICDIKFITALASVLRTSIESITRERAMSVGKNKKMEILYKYLTGVEFKQRVEAIIEAFSNMDEGLRKERMAYEKIWAEREKQIKKVITNTVGMYGDLSGLVTLPQIKLLELGDGKKSE